MAGHSNNNSNNNQDTYVNFHTSPFSYPHYILHVSAAITAVLILILIPLWMALFCIRRALKRRHTRTEERSHYTYQLVMHPEEEEEEEQLRMHVEDQDKNASSAVARRRGGSSLVRRITEMLLGVESLWTLFVCFALQAYLIAVVALYSVQLRYYGLLASIAMGMLFTFAAMLHTFRSDRLVSSRSTAPFDVLEHNTPMSQGNAAYHRKSRPLSPGMRNRSNSSLLNQRREESDGRICFKLQGGRKNVNAVTKIPSSYFRSLYSGVKRQPWMFTLTSLLSMLFTAMLYLFFFGSCLCLHPLSFSTAMTRSFFGRTCLPDEICYTYLNLAENPSSEVIVKFHTSDKLAGDSSPAYVLYGMSADNLNQRIHCTSANFSPYTMDYFHGTKYVHTCELTRLHPDTMYHFRPVLETLATGSGSRKKLITTPDKEPPLRFKTLHNDENRSVRFVSGGDLGASLEAFHLLDIAIQQDPDFIAIGGDIAYENGFTTCYRRWDTVLKHYSTHAITKEGALIPILSTIGNHEVSWNRFSMMPWNARSYLHFFTHKLGIQRGDVAMSNEGVFHAHNLAGHTKLLALDSGLILPHGAQNAFIEEQLKDPTVSNKIAMYHAPLYPSKRDFDARPSARGREMWEHLFNTHGLQVALEHHDHTFKRTKQLRGGKVVPSGGTVYLGDGLMGVSVRSSLPDREYLEKTEPLRHIWLIETFTDGATYSAIDENGKEFDTLVIE